MFVFKWYYKTNASINVDVYVLPKEGVRGKGWRQASYLGYVTVDTQTHEIVEVWRRPDHMEPYVENVRHRNYCFLTDDNHFPFAIQQFFPPDVIEVYEHKCLGEWSDYLLCDPAIILRLFPPQAPPPPSQAPAPAPEAAPV